jgi:hypothetical protein
MNQLIPVYTFSLYLRKIPFYIILPSVPNFFVGMALFQPGGRLRANGMSALSTEFSVASRDIATNLQEDAIFRLLAFLMRYLAQWASIGEGIHQPKCRKGLCNRSGWN